MADVTRGSAAAEAGFERGDVVVEFDGVPVTSSADFRMAVADAGADQDFTAEVIRRGGRKALRPRSAAAAARLAPGDVILEVGREEVDSPEQVAEALPEDGPVLLLVTRRGAARYLVLERPGA